MIAQFDLDVKYLENANEYAVIYAETGEIITFAETAQKAHELLVQHLRTRRKHAQRCPDDIPFMGEPVQGNEPVRECDEYGLEAVA